MTAASSLRCYRPGTCGTVGVGESVETAGLDRDFLLAKHASPEAVTWSVARLRGQTTETRVAEGARQTPENAETVHIGYTRLAASGQGEPVPGLGPSPQRGGNQSESSTSQASCARAGSE
jgi:hypothetical protein